MSELIWKALVYVFLTAPGDFTEYMPVDDSLYVDYAKLARHSFWKEATKVFKENDLLDEYSSISFLYQFSKLKEYYEIKDTLPPSWCQYQFNRNLLDLTAARDINSKYLEHCEYMNATNTYFTKQYEQIIEETKELGEIYSIVYQINWEHNSVAEKRMYLKKLKEYIGEDNFWKGYIPPPVPVHRFTRIN